RANVGLREDDMVKEIMQLAGAGFLLSMSSALVLAEGEASANTIGQFAAHNDIGAVKHAGSAQYNEQDQHYVISGSGKNMWFGEDELHFVYNKIKGDFIVRAEIKFHGEGVDPHRKAGWNLRSSLDTGAPNIHATVHGDGLTSLQFRAEKGGGTDQYLLNLNAPNVIQLERRDDTYIMSAAH